jgi:hypothetical protein
MEALNRIFTSSSNATLWIQGFVVLVGAVVTVVSFAFLIPLDSVPAVQGVSIIMAVSYSISVLLWLLVLFFYARDTNNMMWLNTHILFLIVIPATISATAMNVISIQNTRNLLAGQITN